MAYNPFDDVIDQDPAYMANGGDLVDEDPSTKILDITIPVPRPTPTPPVPDFISQGRQIRDKQEKLQKLQDLYTQSAFTQSMQPVYEQRQQEDFSDVQQTIASGVAPIFEGIAASETADRGKAKKEKNEQIKQQLGFGNQLLSKSQMDEAKQYGYEPLTIGETFAAIPDFMYGDQAESFRKLADGEQLEEGDKYNIIMSPLDALDFLGVGIASGAVFKLLKRLKDKYKVPNLQKILDNPAFAGDGDVEEVRQIVMGAAPPQGLPIEQGGRGQTVMFDKPDVPGGSSTPIKSAKTGTIAERVTTYLDQLPKGERVGMTKLVRDLNLTNRQVRAVLDEKRYSSYFDKIDKTIIEAEGSKAQQVKNFLENVSGTTTYKEIANNLNMTESSVRDVIKAKTIGKLKNKIIPSKTSDIPDKIRDYLKNLDEPVSYEFLADELGLDSRTISSTIHFVTKNNPELSAKVFTDYGKKDFGQGLERPIDFLKRTFNAMPTGEKITKKELKKKYGLSNDNINSFLAKNKDYIEYIEPPKTKFKKSKGEPADVVTPILNEYKSVLGIQPGSRTEFLFFDGMLRSSSPEAFGLDPSMYSKKDFYRLVMSDFAENNSNWRQTFAKDLETMKKLETDRDATNIKMEEYFNEMKKKHPETMKDLNFTDYRLNVAHNIPLGLSGKDFPEVGGLTGAARLSFAKTNLKHHKRLEELLMENLKEIREQGLIEKTADGKIKVPSDFNKFLSYLDEEAKKLGTVIYYKLGDEVKKVGMEATPSPEALLSSFKNHINGLVRNREKYSPKKTDDNFAQAKVFLTSKKEKEYFDDVTDLARGGEVKPVRMAIGGDPLTNLNQQQFSPDPAFEGQDYFQEAVDSGNLQAANLFNLFKVFNKPKVMATPSNVKKVEDARDPIPAPTGSQEIAPLPAGKQDFFFKSFFLDQLNSQNAPKASTPQGWREFLIKGRKVPEAEMMDTGILQYLEDTEKFYPNKKITKQDLENLYDMSPLGNLEVRVKEIKAPGFDEGQFTLDQGRPRHKGAGNAAIDEAADDYFEVVVNVPQLPGQEKVFVNSGHFAEPNVLGFTRVGTYKNADNQTVAVIQEMQTDMLTEVRKEQERLFAMVNALKRQRADLARQVEQARSAGFPGNLDYATNKLRQFDQQYPESFLNDLATDNLIQPFPNIVAKELIPEKTRNLNAIQDDINKLSMANVEQYADPAYKTKIFDLAQEQTKILDDLMSMNRSSNYKEKLQDFKVPSTSNREELQRIGETDTYLPSSYNMKQLESFPPIPFNKQADYVDLLIKSTIKAAKQKGIDRVAIMPADIGANPRWSKTTDEAKKKFQNLYDKVGVQQLKNIAKKYDGTLNVEKIIDPSKTNRGLTFLNKNPDGEFQVLKQTETKKNLSDAERDAYYDEEITRIAKDVNEPGDIVIQREIAPGQMMDYYVVEGRGDATDVGYRMIPLKENENADDAIIKIVEYNPSAIDMYTISFDPSKLEEPMYLFKKKSGGTIDKDSLVSITDIYGEYGR